VFPFADVLHLLADEFTCLRGRRFAFALVAPGTAQCLFLRHDGLLFEICLHGFLATSMPSPPQPGHPAHLQD
jgi:hypothetical protein